MDKLFDPYFDILMNWASRFEKPKFNEKFTKFFSLIFKIFGKQVCILYFTRP